MKLSLTFLALAVATVQADLASQWNINYVTAAKAGDVYTFSYDQLGNEMSIGNMQAKVFKGDCEGATYATFTSADLVVDTEVTGLTVDFTAGDGTNNDGSTVVGVTLDPAAAAQDTGLWTAQGTDGGGTMEFCVRYGLYSGTNEINYSETIVTLVITMVGGFAVEAFDVSEKEKETSTQTQAYTVAATLCSGGADPTFLQGALICVIVEPDSTDVVVSSISAFSWTNGVGQDQIAVPNLDGLTSYDEVAAGNTFSTILYAQFYEVGIPVSGTGTANLAFARRRLGSDNGRALQELGADAEQDFSIVADIVKSEDGPTALQTAGGATASFVVTIFGLVGAVLLA
jgi:hypothetical protein